MADTIEIIIKAVDQYSKPAKNAEDATKNIGKAAKATGLDMQALRRGVLLAVGALYGIERVLQTVADRARELGRNDVANAFDRAKNSVQLFIDTLLQIPLVNGNLLDWFKTLADGFGLAMKEMTIVAIFFIDGLKGMGIAVLRIVGEVQEALGITTQWTQAWYDTTKASIAAADALAIANVWTNNLNTSVAKLTHGFGDLSKLELANVRTLDEVIKGTEKLNRAKKDSLGLDDAIRAGDARAFVAAKNGGSGGGGSANGFVSRPGRVAPSNSGSEHITVNVSIGNRAISSHIKTQVVKTLMGGKSDAQIHPGKGQ